MEGGSVAVRRFVFEFDNGSYLPINTYQLGLTTYIIADDSEGINIEDNSYYIYKNGKWNLSHNEIPTSYNDTTITNNGNYSIPANTITGINNVDVDVPSQEPTLISKSITANDTYNATDDGADGYSSVSVDVGAHMNKLEVSVPYQYSGSSYSLSIVRIYSSENGVYNNISTDSEIQSVILGNPLVKADITQMMGFTTVVFTVGNDFDGFYIDGEKITPTGDTIGSPSKYDTYIGTATDSGGITTGINITKLNSYQFPFTFNLT